MSLFRHAGLLACVAVCLFAAPALAEVDCPMTSNEIFATEEYTRLRQTRLEIVKNRDASANTIEQVAAQFGHVLGQQAQHLGDNPRRNEWFACARMDMASRLATLSIVAESDLGKVDEAFQSALLGIYTDEELEELGVNTDMKVDSVFDAFWEGIWTIEAKAKLAAD